MRQNIIFSTLAVAVAPAAAMAAPGHYMSDKGVAIAVTGGSEQTVFESSTVQLPKNNDDDGLRAFYLKYDFANSNLPTGTKVRIYYGDILLSERDATAASSVWPITPNTPPFVVPDDFPESGATLKLTVQLPDGVETGSISDIRLTAEKKYVNKHILPGFYIKVQQYATTIQTAGYTLSNDDNADLLLMQDLSVEGKEEKTVENYQKYDIFNGTETIETAFKELQAKIEKAEIDKAVAAAEQAIGDIDAAKQKLNDIIDPDKNYSPEAQEIAKKILKDIEDSEAKKQELKDAEDGMKEYDAEKLADLQKKTNDLKALDAYIAWQLKASDTQIAIDQYKALLDELDATVNTDVVLDKDGKFTEGGAGLGAYQLLAFRNWMGRLKGKQAALDAFIAKGAENYKAYEDGNATEFAVPENVKGGDWLKDGEGNYIKSFTDPIYDGYAWLNGTDAYVATLKANKYTDEQINNTINGLKTSVFGETKAFAKIEDLLGTEKTPEIGSDGIPKHIKDGSVLGNIAYVKGCAMLYTQKSAQVYDEVIAAEKDYNERMTLLGAEFQKYKYTVGGEEKVVFEDALPTVREFLYQLIMKDTRPGHEGTPGVLTIKDELTAVKKAGGDISYITGYENKGFGKQPNPDFTKDGDYVPWQEWENLLLKTLTKDADSYAVKYVTGWANYAKSAYERYTDLKALVTGTTDKDHQLQAMLNAMLPGEGDPALDATVKANLDDIQKLINELSTKLDEAVNKIEDVDVSGDKNHLDNFLINNQDFDKTAASGKWNDAGYGEGSADEYHSYANIMAKLQKMSKAIEELGKIDLLAKRLKDASDALNAMTPATSDDPSATLYTGRFAYKATDFYGFKDIDDPTTTADEAAANEGWAKVITDWLKAARAKLIGDPTLDYTQPSFADGDDNFSDGNGGFVKYDDINNDITALETGGNGFDGVTNWKALLDLVKADSVRIDEIESQVKDHGIYTDPTYDYKTLIENWRQEIANFFELYNWYASTYPNTDEAHWLDLKNASYTSLTLADDAQIATDKAAKELAVLKQQVDALYTYLYGDNGYDEAGSTPGYIDTVLGQYKTVKAAYDDLIKDKTPDDVFGSTANSADRGNAETLAAIMGGTLLNNIKMTTGSNSDQSQAIQDYKALGTTPTKAQLDDVNDKLLKVRDQLDVFYKTMKEGEKINDITATEGKPNATLDGMETMPTNLGLLQQLITDLANNKTAYDELINIKGKLEQRVNTAFDEISTMEQTQEVKDLKAEIEKFYQPVPSDETPKILEFYKTCKAHAQSSAMTVPTYQNKDEETGKFWVLDKDKDYIQDSEKGRELEYYILKKTLENLNTRMDQFNDGYSNMIADNNNKIYADKVVPAFNDAMATFDKAVTILNKFKTPTYPSLLAAFQNAFPTATQAIYPAANNVRAAQFDANANMEAANNEGKGKLYDPTADVTAINNIKLEIVSAINTFIEAMQNASQNALTVPENPKEKATAAIVDADQKITKVGDEYKFNKVDDGNGNLVPYVYTKEDYFDDEYALIAKADDLANMIKTNGSTWTTTADGINDGDFDQFLEFDKYIQNEQEGLQSIPASVQEKLNQAAYEDLGNRIKEFVDATVKPIENKFKGGYEGYEEKINLDEFTALKAAEKIDPAVSFDDFCAEYGYGADAANGYRYTYKFALGDDFQAQQKLFTDLKTATVDEATKKSDEYYKATQLPSYDGKDENGLDKTFETRQEVLDLLNAFDSEDLNENLTADKIDVTSALDDAYQKNVIDNQQYLADYDDLKDRLAEQKLGIESLYVGPEFADDLKALEDDLNAHQSDANIPDLNKQLDKIVKDAKKAETEALTQEIINLKDDYNQMVKEADDKMTDFKTKNGDPSTWTDEQKAEYAALKATRDDLVKKYTTKDEVEQGETPTKDQLALDIDENTNTLNVYDTYIDDTHVPFFGVDTSADNDPSYDELKKLEGNVSKIKEEIALDRGDKTAEEIAALPADLLARWQKVWDAESKYIAGQKLMEPENPQEDGFMGADFGLNKYYLNADFKTYNEQYLKGYTAALNTLKANIEAHKADIMLYFDMFDQTLKDYELWLLPDANDNPSNVDKYINCNDADVQPDSYFLKSEAEKKMAQKHADAKAALQAKIDAVWEQLEKAKSDIDNYGLTTTVLDAEGNEVEVPVEIDYASAAKDLNMLQVRLNTYYLKRDGAKGDNPFDENVNLDNTKGKASYELYLFKENKEKITEEWLAQFAAGEGDNKVSLAQYYNAETGIVTLPKCNGLTFISESIADQVEDFTEEAALREWTKAQQAYNDAEDVIDETEMRYVDKMALYQRLYGADSANDDETVYETDDLGNLVLDGEGNPIVKTPDTSFQKLLNVDLFDAIYEQTPESMDAYKQKVQEYIDALNALSIEAKATRVGDIAGGGDDGLQPDGSVDVIDLQRLLNLVNQPLQQKELTEKQFQASDLNNDGYIDIVDLGIMTDIMVGATSYLYDVDPDTKEPVFASRQLATTSETLRADVVATDGNSQRIAISLSNERAYTGFQMDITLPEGMRLVGQSLSDRADGQQLYANEWNGKTRLVGFTATKAAFTGNDGAVVYLDVETDESYKGGSVKYDDIIFLTTNAKGVKFQMQGETTGVISRFADAAKETIYNLGGRVMNGLKKGVNILRGNDGAKKVIKK